MHISSTVKVPETAWPEWSAVRLRETTTTLRWCEETQKHFPKQKTLFRTNFGEGLDCLEPKIWPHSCWLDQPSKIGLQDRNQHLFWSQTFTKVCSEQSFLFWEVFLCFLTPAKSCGGLTKPDSAPFRPCSFGKLNCTANVHNRDICIRS